MKNSCCIFILIIFVACNTSPDAKLIPVTNADTLQVAIDTNDVVNNNLQHGTSTKKTALEKITTTGVERHELVTFSKTLIGIRYLYASTEPANGFDCSGFITYVFNHFNVDVPRASVDFTNVGNEVNLNTAQAGDLILFTGTDDGIRTVGHMGIVVENADSLRFIHSTSGRANGVTITALTDHYKKRLVKLIRVFNEN